MNETKQLLVPLNIPVPPQLEDAIGYSSDARYVAFYWTPAGDEVMYDDGQISADGHWAAWLAWIDHPTVAPRLFQPCPRCNGPTTTDTLHRKPCTLCNDAGLLPLNLGSSDYDASEWLILDRQQRKCFAAPVTTARHFLQEQWPPSREPTPEEQEAIL